jgi:hypothetical protein
MQNMPPKISIQQKKDIKLSVGYEMDRLQKRTCRGKPKPIDNLEEIMQANTMAQADRDKYKKTDK